MQGTLFGLFDLFAGGAFARLTVFALGIMPYISRLDHPAAPGGGDPDLEKLRKEGEEGQKKITQYTRYGTVALSLIQSFGFAWASRTWELGRGGARRPDPGWGSGS